MTARLGLSSGSAPRLTATELAELTRDAGGGVVDLRAGKGHRWEEQGTAGLRDLPVAFVGISVVLGRPGQDTGAARHFPGHCLKVFAAPGVAGSPYTAEQIVALTRDRDPGQVLVETHLGGADPGELAVLCERLGCRLVIDNLGLSEIAHDVASELSRLAPWAAAVQVKGFTRPDASASGSPSGPADGDVNGAAGGDTSGSAEAGAGGAAGGDAGGYADASKEARPVHRPLVAGDLAWLRLFGSTDIDITVESRAGTPREDLATLRRAWEGVTCG